MSITAKTTTSTFVADTPSDADTQAYLDFLANGGEDDYPDEPYDVDEAYRMQWEEDLARGDASYRGF